MKSDNSWYARKFGRQQAPQGRPQPVQSQQQQPNQYIQFQQQPPPGYNPQPDPRSIKVTPDNLWQAMQFWQGGKAHKVDPYPCPECGSMNFSGRTEGILRGPPPAPHCFNCGFNGMFTQGLQSSWQ